MPSCLFQQTPLISNPPATIVRHMFGPDAEYQDGISGGAPARGRGSASLNPGNRFEEIRLHVLGEHIDAQLAEYPNGVQIQTQALRDNSKTIINKVVDSPDIPFEW